MLLNVYGDNLVILSIVWESYGIFRRWRFDGDSALVGVGFYFVLGFFVMVEYIF